MRKKTKCHVTNFDGEEQLLVVGGADCEMLWVACWDESTTSVPVDALIRCVNNEVKRVAIGSRLASTILKKEVKNERARESALGRVLLQHAYGCAASEHSNSASTCHCAESLFSELSSGRPHTDDVSVSLFNANMSHDAGAVAVAGTSRGFVGVDIMRVWTGHENISVREYAEKYSSVFHKSELSWIDTQRDDLLRAVLSIWVAKEAAAKATGWGFSKDTDPQTLLVTPLGSPGRFRVTFLGLDNFPVLVNEEEVNLEGCPYIVGTAVVAYSAPIVMESLRATVVCPPAHAPQHPTPPHPEPLQIPASLAILS